MSWRPFAAFFLAGAVFLDAATPAHADSRSCWAAARKAVASIELPKDALLVGSFRSPAGQYPAFSIDIMRQGSRCHADWVASEPKRPSIHFLLVAEDCAPGDRPMEFAFVAALVDPATGRGGATSLSGRVSVELHEDAVVVDAVYGHPAVSRAGSGSYTRVDGPALSTLSRQIAFLRRVISCPAAARSSR